MKRILLRSTRVTVLSVIASLALGASVIPALGGSFGWLSIIMCTLCPLAIALPLSLYTSYHRQRLADAHERLRRAHEALAASHRELENTHARLAEKSRHDDMTGMLNRETFLSAVAETRSGALLIIDVDHFKAINDRFGHLAGDEALAKIAGALHRGIRADDLLGRIGGEEFGVLLAGADHPEAARVAEHIRRAVEAIAFSMHGAVPVPLTVSIGAALIGPQASLSELLRGADKRLYEAKYGGRNRVVMPPYVSVAA